MMLREHGRWFLLKNVTGMVDVVQVYGVFYEILCSLSPKSLLYSAIKLVQPCSSSHELSKATKLAS